VFDEVEQQLQNPAIDDIVALPCESSEQQLQNITPVDELLQQLQNLNLNGGVEQQPQVSVYVLNEHENVSFISLFQELNQNIVFVPWETLPQLTAGSDRSTELEQQPENSIADDEVEQQPHNTVRRKPSRPETWKRNKAKVWRESGKQYINVAGKTVSARKIQHRKHSFNCRMKCEDKMTADDRQVIHDEFWTLSESQKRNYFARTTCRESKKRTRTDRGRRTNKIRSRVYSYKYYFVVNDVRVQVCKSYYLATLDISNTRICTYYATRNQSTGTPSQRQQGRHVKKRIADEHRDAVRAHINSFPRVESHYCRATTDRQYLDSALSLSRMYDLFVESRLKQNRGNSTYVEPVKKHLYETVFNTEFNLGFHIPKKDRCDTCEAFYHATSPSQKAVDEQQAVMGKSQSRFDLNRDLAASKIRFDRLAIRFEPTRFAI